MEPPIQYSRTSDGVDIAYWAFGEGVPLVAMPSLPWSHLQLEWSIPAVRRWYERLGKDRLLVRYDGRGFGLSQRDVRGPSLETDVLDLVAVVDRIGADNVDLFAALHSGPAAIAYAARYPESVKHLVLFCSYSEGMSLAGNPLTQVTRPIIEQDWEFYTQIVARLLLGWTEPEAAQGFADLVRACTSPEFAAQALAATASFDVTSLLGEVRAPTLVIHRPEQRISTMDNARVLAGGIRDARLSLQSGDSIAPYLGQTEVIVEEIHAFLADREPASVGDGSEEGPGTWTGGMSTVVFTDVVESTEIVDRLGDEAARSALRDLEDVVSAAAAARAGRLVKHLGDGSLLEFALASDALAFAETVQTELGKSQLQLRIGMAAGEPIREEGDLHGAVVVLASRITDAAGSGEVVVSDGVRQLVLGKHFHFEDLGEHKMKGFDEPTRIWRLQQ